MRIVARTSLSKLERKRRRARLLLGKDGSGGDGGDRGGIICGRHAGPQLLPTILAGVTTGFVIGVGLPKARVKVTSGFSLK